ncbi:MAG: PilC/PilY family type IV pilus protein [Thermodesulfovibrionales bacterium]|nr:PilC/PilY family type IV pilus protein [Thermodesulfovibrionales bacterium]
MVKIINRIFLIFIMLCFVFSGNVYSDETALFTTVAPDALIVLDLSGSMDWNPAGDTATSTSLPCTTSSCSRLAIAKTAIFNILDDNNDNTINSSDESSLNIRIGYMRFREGNDTSGNYTSGNIKLIWDIGSRYSRIYCNNATSCTITTNAGESSSATWISGERANGGTPLASALNEAKLYLDAHKAGDTAGRCRQKFAILITDGADTYACSGDGTESQSDMYKRRRETVAKAKALADAGYKVFVIGFGASMPTCLQRTLNWAAYYGQTDNPLQANSGDTSGYNIPAGSFYPSGVSSCSDTSTSVINDICSKGGGTGDRVANSNDPATAPLSGYAFLATNADELTAALRQAINIIREANYAFSAAAVASTRTQDENYIYEASFQPVNDDPFWLGHLKKYTINADGSVGSAVWDAGTQLQAKSAANRNIYTYKSGSNPLVFNTTNITAADLGVSTSAERDAVVGYIRGEATYNPDNWKLGDIFRSNPVLVGTPLTYFNDFRDVNNAFSTFRTNNQRTSANGLMIVAAGANDGQFHAFKTSDGSEAWSFIPPNLLPKLKLIAHTTHPTGLAHQYFVDGPVTHSDVWLGTGDGTSKSADDWKTLVVFGEGRGAGAYLWSSSSSCDSGFNSTYSATYRYYCGYHALDVTNTLSPLYKWNIVPSSTNAPYLGEPWSKMSIGRVKIGGNEKWVGFIGGGYNASDCSGGGSCDTRGKGFYVVDMSNGNVLWSYTRADNSSMNYSFPAPPAALDTDNDGFVDTVYIGDLGGSMWRFKLCTASDDSSCNTSTWTTRAGFLFQASSGVIRPIYTKAVVAKDASGNMWVYWGTGDKTDPTSSAAQEKFYALKDGGGSYGINDMENLTASGSTYSGVKQGWYINLSGSGEKILAEPAVFGGVVYFTTYTPATGSNPCEQAGTPKLYAVGYTTGGGVLTGGARTTTLSGVGIPSAPIISLRPDTGTPDLYVTVSGGAGQDARTTKPPGINPQGLSNTRNIKYWKDRRLQ